MNHRWDCLRWRERRGGKKKRKVNPTLATLRASPSKSCKTQFKQTSHQFFKKCRSLVLGSMRETRLKQFPRRMAPLNWISCFCFFFFFFFLFFFFFEGEEFSYARGQPYTVIHPGTMHAAALHRLSHSSIGLQVHLYGCREVFYFTWGSSLKASGQWVKQIQKVLI